MKRRKLDIFGVECYLESTTYKQLIGQHRYYFEVRFVRSIYSCSDGYRDS
jgi:hypothetical protein